MNNQGSGVIKAQPGTVRSNHGDELRKTSACFFVDFSCITSVIKGLRSLEKHVRKLDGNITGRWGFFVQKTETTWDELGVAFCGIRGAKYVRASLKDVPCDAFEHYLMPPTLPHLAFTLSHMWGRPLAWWAALKSHSYLCWQATKDCEALQNVDQRPFRLDTPVHRVVPVEKRIAPCTSKKIIGNASKRLQKTREIIAELCSDESLQEFLDEFDLEGRMLSLYNDCRPLVRSTREAIGWSTDGDSDDGGASDGGGGDVGGDTVARAILSLAHPENAAAAAATLAMAGDREVEPAKNKRRILVIEPRETSLRSKKKSPPPRQTLRERFLEGLDDAEKEEAGANFEPGEEEHFLFFYSSVPFSAPHFHFVHPLPSPNSFVLSFVLSFLLSFTHFLRIFFYPLRSYFRSCFRSYFLHPLPSYFLSPTSFVLSFVLSFTHFLRTFLHPLPSYFPSYFLLHFPLAFE